MTKRETWLFAVVCTILAAGSFIALTIHSHTRFDDLTNSENLTPQVKAGMHVWHSYNCVNCHTIFGEGAYYAPDLTNITKQRGEAYLKAFLKKPSRFYSEEEYGRVMPNLDMTDKEIDDVIAFLDWISEVKTNGWPPRPIRVTGEAIRSTTRTPEGKADDRDADPVAKGRRVFNDSQIGCNACHSTSQGVTIVGPSMAGLQSRAKELIQSDDYTGDAESARAYIRESIIEPDAHILEGKNFSTNGTSLMPGDYSDRMSDTQLDYLVEYLTTLE
jgi:nitric oxide reductase subunit C